MSNKETYNEEDLIAGCQRNERLWQERLYRKYFNGFYQMCLYYAKSPDKAMDYLNLGFLRCFKKIYLCEHTGSLEAWLRKTIWHVIINELKRENKEIKFDELSQAHHEIAIDQLDLFLQNDVTKLIDKLPPATAVVFRLFAQDGFSHKEIAQQLEITEGTSKWHVASAREQMKKLIKEYEI